MDEFDHSTQDISDARNILSNYLRKRPFNSDISDVLEKPQIVEEAVVDIEKHLMMRNIIICLLYLVPID